MPSFVLRAVTTRRQLAHLSAAALAALSFHWPAFAQVVVTPSLGIVGFDQLNEGAAMNAEEGQVTVDVSGALSQLGNPAAGGFLNVADNQGNWLVQNLPIFSIQSPSITTRYDIPDTTDSIPNDHDGTNVTGENLVAVLSTTTFSAAPTGSAVSFSIGDTEFDGGGGGDTGDLVGYEPEGQISVQGDLQFDGGVTPVLLHYQTQHPNVQAARNQCAPAATSNSLDWLRTTTGLAIKKNADNTVRTNTPGIRTDAPNDTLVGNLELQMSRQNIASRTTGSGVWPLDGLLKFASTETGIITRYAVSRTATFSTYPGNGGGKLDGAANYTRYGQTSYAAGSTINFDLIDGFLSQGYALLMDEAWGADGAGGRHYVQILGDGKIDNKPYIVFSSDLLQTPSDPNDLRLGDYFPLKNSQAGFDSGIEFDWLGGVNGDFLMNHNSVIDQLIAINVPEPGTVTMIVIGVGLLAARRRRAAHRLSS
jgi:hypothetical protein